jgi:hypothetical protein
VDFIYQLNLKDDHLQMKKLLQISVCLSLILVVWACEQPESPDFQLIHELEVPLSIEKTYPFMGEDEALIDSTSEDYADLLFSDGDGSVRLTKEEDFDFGDLDEAIPTVDADPTTVNAEVGEIGLTNFSSASGNVGEAGFTSITGASSPPAGQTIPGGSGTVNIPFTTDYFESAVIKNDGDLELTLTNNLGFHIDELEISLNSGTDFVGSTTIGTEGDSNDMFEHNSQKTTTITIPASTTLSDLNADITVKWDQQTMQEEGDNLVVNDVAGKNLVASQVTAAIESQSFTDAGTSTIDQSSFEFREADDFVELNSGELTITINNNIDLGVESLAIDFPDIFDDSGNPVQINATNIPASSDGGNYSQTIDLSGYRIKAHNGTIDYSIDATTENTQETNSTRTINESDVLDAEVNLSNLGISRAEGFINTDVVLNEDMTNDGRDNVDVFNDNEAEITNIDGISDISDRISGLTFENPILSTLYTSNLGVKTTIYAVIAGTDNKGNTEYLTGTDGSEYQVQSGEIPQELEVNGQPATTDQVIKFSIEPADSPDPNQGEFGSNEFNSSNTNSSAFFSNLPNKISFVGAAVINDDGIIVNPVIFDPSLGLDLPLNFSADAATFKDTLDADLEDLPGEDDDQKLKEATLTLNYTNALPLDLDLTLIMLDENDDEVTRKESITVDGAGVDANGYVNQPAESNVQISFSEEELKTLNDTRSMELDVELNTPQQQAVRIRKDDSVTLQIQIKADIATTVN